MRLAQPPLRYDPQHEAQRDREIEQADRANYKKGADVIIAPPRAGSARGQRLILVSPNGTQYAVVVADDGTLGTVAV